MFLALKLSFGYSFVGDLLYIHFGGVFTIHSDFLKLWSLTYRGELYSPSMIPPLRAQFIGLGGAERHWAQTVFVSLRVAGKGGFGEKNAVKYREKQRLGMKRESCQVARTPFQPFLAWLPFLLRMPWFLMLSLLCYLNPSLLFFTTLLCIERLP